MQRTLIGAGVLIAALAVAAWLASAPVAQAPTSACTEEAKICPDGSTVVRTGPNCEFAECPMTATSTPVSLEARLGQTVTALDVAITPLEVLEDSRCPSDVVCIQAGTVRIRARLASGLGEGTQEFKLGQPITTEAEEVTLVEVTPYPRASAPTKPADYLFRFEVAERSIGVY